MIAEGLDVDCNVALYQYLTACRGTTDPVMAETNSSTPAAAVTVAVAEPQHVTANVVASGPAPAAEKTPEVSSKPKEPAATTPGEAKPAAAPAPAVNPAPPANPSATSGNTFKGKGDDFYNTIFYFSGKIYLKRSTPTLYWILLKILVSTIVCVFNLVYLIIYCSLFLLFLVT